MVSVENRVDSLEDLVKKVSTAQLKTEQTIDQLGQTINQLGQTLDESHQRTERELQSLSDEMKVSNTEMNIRWGNLANKMGTIIEDIVAPSIYTIAKHYFRCEPFQIMQRVKKRIKPLPRREFDVIAACTDFVLLNETKSTPSRDYIDEFHKFIESSLFFQYFPEYKGKKLIPIFSALSIDDDLIQYCTGKKIYAGVMKGSVIDLANFKEMQT